MKIASVGAQSELPWIAELAASSEARARAIEWGIQAAKAYPPNTLRAWRADWLIYAQFCRKQGHSTVPGEPKTVAAFIEDRGAAGKKPATIRRYLSTIALAHRVAKLSNPCSEEVVRLALKSLTNEVPVAQRQARGLGWAEIKRFLETSGKGLRASRERALLCVAYDTMARRSELVAFNRGDIAFTEDGSGRARIRRSKTDQEGHGHSAYLSPLTVRYLKEWLEIAQIKQGAIFRRLIGTGVPPRQPHKGSVQRTEKDQIGGRLRPGAIAKVIKAVGKFLGLSAEQVKELSGHSIRVGATQDLLALNIDLASVMQAGRWKSHRMPVRYGENVLAAQGAMARAALVQGRTALR